MGLISNNIHTNRVVLHGVLASVYYLALLIYVRNED